MALVPSATVHFVGPCATLGGQLDDGANCVAIARDSDKGHLEPIGVSGAVDAVVAQDRGTTTRVEDDHIKIAIVVEVVNASSAT